MSVVRTALPLQRKSARAGFARGWGAGQGAECLKFTIAQGVSMIYVFGCIRTHVFGYMVYMIATSLCAGLALGSLLALAGRQACNTLHTQK